MGTELRRRDLGLAPTVEEHFWSWLSELDATLTTERGDLENALAWVRGTFEVTDNATLETAAAIVASARDRAKALEDSRKAFTGPLLAAKAQVDAVYKGSTEPLLSTIETAKAKMAAYTRAQEVARQQIVAQSAATYAAGGTPTDLIPEPAQAKGVSTKVRWVPTITNADAVPRELCSPDLDKIKKAIFYADTSTPPLPIPGVRFDREDRVVVR